MSETLSIPPFYLVVELEGWPSIGPRQTDRNCYATTDASHVVHIVFGVREQYRVLKVFPDGSTSLWYDMVDPTFLSDLTRSGMVSSLEAL